MGLFSKIGKGISNATKFVGKNIGKVAAIAAPIAAIGALAIPVLGPAVSGIITKISGVASKVEGVTGTAQNYTSSIGGLGSVLTGGTPAAAQTAGGLFGKGGFLGTGLFASAEDKLINAENKAAKMKAKIVQKASDLFGIKVTDYDQAKAVLSGAQLATLDQHLASDPELMALAAATGTTPGAGSDNGLLVKVGLGLLAAKLLKFI